jgi:cell division protein FtsQ
LPRTTKFSIVTGALLATFAGLVYLFAWSSIFTASSIVISGAPNADSKRLILASSGVEVGQKLARIEPRSIAQRLTEFTWIKDVQVSRNWIAGDVRISIEPRTPKAYFAGKTIDATGTVFLLPGFAATDLPYVSASKASLGADAIALFQSLPESFRSQVISLTAHNESNFSIRHLHQGREVRVKWGSAEKSELKVEVLTALLKLPENQKIRRVDLSAPHAPIVK